MEVLKQTLKYGGIVKLSDLYKLMHDLFDGLDWKMREKKMTWKEEVRKQKKNVTFEWIAVKEIDSYCRALLKITTRVFNWKEDIDKATGKKVEKALLNISFKCELETDYKGYFKKGILSYFKDFYEKKIYKGKLLTNAVEIKEEVIHYINEVRSFLGLQKFM